MLSWEKSVQSDLRKTHCTGPAQLASALMIQSLGWTKPMGQNWVWIGRFHEWNSQTLVQSLNCVKGEADKCLPVRERTKCRCVGGKSRGPRECKCPFRRPKCFLYLVCPKVNVLLLIHDLFAYDILRIFLSLYKEVTAYDLFCDIQATENNFKRNSPYSITAIQSVQATCPGWCQLCAQLCRWCVWPALSELHTATGICGH